jgi:hypothetical protein
MCGRNQRLTRKLGRWTSDGAKTAVWWFCPRVESLFKRTPVVTVTFPLRSSRNKRNSLLQFKASPTHPAEIPLTVKPCCIAIQGQYVLLQGFDDPSRSRLTRTVTPPPRVTSRTFTNFLDSLEDKAWIFTSIMIRGSLTVMVHAIHNGTCSCVTDGSFKDTHGTAAWKIADPGHPEHSFEGQCVTPGTSVQQNSYHSELRGL